MLTSLDSRRTDSKMMNYRNGMSNNFECKSSGTGTYAQTIKIQRKKKKIRYKKMKRTQ